MKKVLIVVLAIVAAVVVGINIHLYSDDIKIFSSSSISKSVDPSDCHVYEYNSDTDILSWTDEINMFFLTIKH